MYGLFRLVFLESPNQNITEPIENHCTNLIQYKYYVYSTISSGGLVDKISELEPCEYLGWPTINPGPGNVPVVGEGEPLVLQSLYEATLREINS